MNHSQIVSFLSGIADIIRDTFKRGKYQDVILRLTIASNGLGARSSTCIDPKTKVVQGKTIRLVSCQRSPEPVFLKWKNMEKDEGGDFYVRRGPGSIRLDAADTEAFIKTRFPGFSKKAE